MGYEKIKKTISKVIPNAVMREVFVEKMGKPLLFVSFEPNITTLRVYNDEEKMAEIRYRLGRDSVFISSFFVDERYQNMGFGRLIFEFSLAHGDAKGATRAYGTASPTDPIKGVSDELDEMNYEKELAALKGIYQKLGCEFIDDTSFVRKWQHGEMISKAKSWQESMIKEAISKGSAAEM